MTTRRFVILDRDGTLIVERNYLSDPQHVELLPGVTEALRRFRAMGLGLVMITNQSAIGRGFFDAARLAQIHRRLEELLAAEGITLDGLYVCPHRPGEGCRCRKPNPGLLEQAAKELGFCAEASFVIGDKVCDVELGRRVGATTVLVRTGYGAQVEQESAARAHHVVNGMPEAVPILERLLTEVVG